MDFIGILGTYEWEMCPMGRSLEQEEGKER